MMKRRMLALALALLLTVGAAPGRAEAARHLCPVCGSEEYAPSEARSRRATCTEEGIDAGWCNRCGENVSGTVPVREHEWGGWEIEKDATDFSAGLRRRICESCGVEDAQPLYPDGTLKRATGATRCAGCRRR